MRYKTQMGLLTWCSRPTCCMCSRRSASGSATGRDRFGQRWTREPTYTPTRSQRSRLSTIAWATHWRRWWKFTDYEILQGPQFPEFSEALQGAEYDVQQIGGHGLGGEPGLPVLFDLPESLLLDVVHYPLRTAEDCLSFAREYGLFGLDPRFLRLPLGTADSADFSDQESFVVSSSEHVQVMLRAHAVLRALDLVAKELRQPEDGRFSPLRLSQSWPEAARLSAPRSVKEASDLLLNEIRRGLLNVVMTADFVSPPEQTSRLTTFALAPALALRASLYSRCVIELFNHILAGREFLPCRNCDRTFVRREPRQVHCNRFCAAQYASRRHRRGQSEPRRRP